jgi:hypothetical protein
LSRREEDEMIGGFRPDFLVFDPNLPEEDTRTYEEVESGVDVESCDASYFPKGEELDVLLLAIFQERSEKKHDSNDNNVNSLSCLVLRPHGEDNSKEYERIGVVNFLEGEDWTKFFDLTRTEAITNV